MTFGVVVEPNKRNENIWISSVPLLPGCNAMGSGMADVLKKTESAILKYFRRHARQFPTIPDSVKCRMISKAEYDAMTSEKSPRPQVLVGVNHSTAVSV